MTIKRTGKCEVCKRPIILYREVLVSVNLFDPDAGLPSEVKKDLIKWRKEKIYCDEHGTEPATTGVLANSDNG
jgi:hypothetical protein